MKLTDYCWTTAESITQKRPTEIKVILEDTERPVLSRDASGFVIRLSSPLRTSDDLLSLHGMSFDNDVEGRLSLFRMFRASLYHLSLHAAVSDFGIYSDAPNRTTKLEANAKFAMSIVEDFAVRGYARSLWPGLLSDLGYANYLSCLRFRDFDLVSAAGLKRGSETNRALSDADKIAANILSYSSVNRSISKIEKPVEEQILKLNSHLLQFESFASRAYSKSTFATDPLALEKTKSRNELLTKERLKLYNEIMDIFESNSAVLSIAHSLPHHESYGPNVLFEAHPSRFAIGEQPELLASALRFLGVEVPPEIKAVEDESDTAESESILGSWEYSISSQNSILEQYKRYDLASHFEFIGFPQEDYAEYERARKKLAGKISALVNQLRVVNFSLDEAPYKELGEIDMESAIQSVASQRPSSGVYKNEELLRRDEAWSIIIDSSKSLEVKKKEVRDLAICLSEIAKDLIPKNSWACYSFDDKFHIIKDFLESYDRTVKGRIGGLPNGVKTLLPDAMKLSAQRLIKGPEEVKVMLVVSDGYPLGYPNIEKEMIKTIEWISNSGILLVGLGIGSSAIKKYFKSNLVVEGTYDLMTSFVQTYAQLPTLIL